MVLSLTINKFSYSIGVIKHFLSQINVLNICLQVGREIYFLPPFIVGRNNKKTFHIM